MYHIKGRVTKEVFTGYEYEISYSDNSLIAYNYNNLTLNINDVVDVLISNTDPSYKVILFKYVNYKKVDNSIGIKDDNINLDLDGGNVIYGFKPIGQEYK